MKITIYDLLGMIKDGEEVPNKIKYRKCIFEYDEEFKDYFTENGIIPTTFDRDGIFRNIFALYNTSLNDEVEILEEPKGIPSKLTPFEAPFLKGEEPDIRFRLIIDRINELIDYLKSKGE